MYLLFADNIVLYLENQKDSTAKWLLFIGWYRQSQPFDNIKIKAENKLDFYVTGKNLEAICKNFMVCNSKCRSLRPRNNLIKYDYF